MLPSKRQYRQFVELAAGLAGCACDPKQPTGSSHGSTSPSLQTTTTEDSKLPADSLVLRCPRTWLL